MQLLPKEAGFSPERLKRVDSYLSGLVESNQLAGVAAYLFRHGKSAYPFMKIDEDYITRNLLADEPDVMKGYGSHVTYKQLTFEDFLTKQ